MAAPAKFLFDVDFAAGSPREPTVTLSDHAVKLAEAEAAARQRAMQRVSTTRRSKTAGESPARSNASRPASTTRPAR
jgi:hypothetical protein